MISHLTLYRQAYELLGHSIFSGNSAIERFDDLSGTSFTWNTNVPAGKIANLLYKRNALFIFSARSGSSISLELKDSSGAVAQSAPFLVGDSCKWATWIYGALGG